MVVSDHLFNPSTSTVHFQTETNLLADLTPSVTSAPESPHSTSIGAPLNTQQSVSQHATRVTGQATQEAADIPISTFSGVISVQTKPQSSGVQQSASQHAATGTQVADRVVAATNSGLSFNAIPFTPQSRPDESSSVADIMKDHSEVEQVLHGGVGTAPEDCPAWLKGSVLPSSGALAHNGLMPFDSCDVPALAGTAAQPVIKTKHLKEFKVTFNGKVFIDRLLPPPAKTMVV